jgi:hypothetical protein
MLLTWATAALGLIGFGCQIAAHILMWENGRPERAPTPRYAVGIFIIGVCFSTGLALDDRQDAIAAFWYNAILSGAATGLCYELRRRWVAKGDRLPPTPADLEMWADAIAGEHDEA